MSMTTKNEDFLWLKTIFFHEVQQLRNYMEKHSSLLAFFFLKMSLNKYL